MEESLMKKESAKGDQIIIKYYIKALLRFDKFQVGIDPKKGF